MSGNFAIKGGGVGRLMANAILNFHFDYRHTSLILFQFAAHFVYMKANRDIWKEYKHIKGGCYKYMAYEYKHIARVAHE